MNNSKFYIIDDDSINNIVCKTIINTYSQSEDVKSFLNAADALAFFQDNDLDEKSIILLDINMPVMNGWDFLDKFCKNKDWCDKSKIFMLSSSIDISDINKSKKYACITDYIVKPFSREKIQTVMAS